MGCGSKQPLAVFVVIAIQSDTKNCYSVPSVAKVNGIFCGPRLILPPVTDNLYITRIKDCVGRSLKDECTKCVILHHERASPLVRVEDLDVNAREASSSSHEGGMSVCLSVSNNANRPFYDTNCLIASSRSNN
jgi:hypothetical protein